MCNLWKDFIHWINSLVLGNTVPTGHEDAQAVVVELVAQEDVREINLQKIDLLTE
jgi:hypothetical protein